ncbi:N-terminal cleavage protein [Opitutaceae bacterium TAV5]|nr:N-terminal cleavage protein [Opitutaceae bacterium TAV5]
MKKTPPITSSQYAHPWTTVVNHRPRKDAFTLIELLTVIAIIGILASLTFVGIQKARQAAHRAKSMSQMRGIVTAALTYTTDNRDQLPHKGNVTDAEGDWRLPDAKTDTNDHVSTKLMEPYIRGMDPAWFDPLAVAGQEARGGNKIGNERWFGRIWFNKSITTGAKHSSLRAVPVRVSSIANPSRALLFFNAQSNRWAGYPDGYGTVGFADGSVKRIKEAPMGTAEGSIIREYIESPANLKGYVE